MQDLSGRVAVVTGAASGIGRALAQALAAEGMRVVVADIERQPAEAVATEIVASGGEAVAQHVDVADPASVDALAAATLAAFDRVHVVCNNAGVLLFGGFRETTLADWQWLYGVNVMGVIHGVHAFLPHLLDHGEPGHIVNTSSVAGLGGSGAYGTTKAAILAITDSLHAELADTPIGVSTLLPGMVASAILQAERNRPDEFGPSTTSHEGSFGLDPSEVGRRLVEGIRTEERYIFAGIPEGFGDLRSERRARTDELLTAIDAGIVADPDQAGS